MTGDTSCWAAVAYRADCRISFCSDCFIPRDPFCIINMRMNMTMMKYTYITSYRISRKLSIHFIRRFFLQNDEFNILSTDTRDLIHWVLEKEFIIMSSVRLTHVHVCESLETVGCNILIYITSLKQYNF